MKDWSRPANQQPATGTTQTVVRESPSSMLQYLGWDSLEERRLRSRATMLYRIVHGLVAIPLHPNLQWNTRETRGHNTKFYVPALRVDAVVASSQLQSHCGITYHLMWFCHHLLTVSGLMFQPFG